MTISQTASILKVGFLLRYFKKEVIRQWAEKRIIIGDDNIFLIELLLIENKSDNEILSLIGSLAAEYDLYDKKFLDQYYLGLFNEVLLKDGTKVDWLIIENEVLRYFSIKEKSLTEEQHFFNSVLNNDYSLRKGGYSGEMKMPDQLLDFLSSYNKFKEMQVQLEFEGVSKPDLLFL